LHRRLADQLDEALGERRSRQRDLAREAVHRPGVRRVAVQQRERARRADRANPIASRAVPPVATPRSDGSPRRTSAPRASRAASERRVPARATPGRRPGASTGATRRLRRSRRAASAAAR
jgi:hypothetical protein